MSRSPAVDPFFIYAMNTPPEDPSRWVKGAERILAATPIFDLKGVRYSHPKRGSEREFVVISPPDWVNVAAITKDGQLVLVNQFRYGIDTFSLEIPGGMLETGEDPLEAGLRELREETGYIGGKARLLGVVHPNPAIINNRCHLVLVEGVELGESQEWDEDEEMTVVTAPVNEVMEWARTGKITHSLVICGLFLLEGHLKGAHRL